MVLTWNRIYNWRDLLKECLQPRSTKTIFLGKLFNKIGRCLYVNSKIKLGFQYFILRELRKIKLRTSYRKGQNKTNIGYFATSL